MDSSLIANSFDQCGITSKDAATYSSQLRHFLRSRQLVDEVEPANVRDEFNTLGDEWSQHDVPDPDDSDDDDSNGEHED